MTTLPLEAQACIERALAELELAVIQIHQHPTAIKPDGEGGYTYLGPTAHERLLTALLVALAHIVDVVTGAGLTAADRRQIVAAYRDQVLTQYEFHHDPFGRALRDQSWWEHFQRGLVEAERTDVPTFGRQLRQVMDEARISVDELVELTANANRRISKRTIERLRADARRPGISTVGTLEAVLTTVRGVPVSFQLPAASRQRRKQQPSRKRSQDAAKRR